MTTPNRFRRLAATVAVSALPLAGASALITAQPAAAQFFPVNPFGTTGFVPGGINFSPNNSTTEVNNFGSGNTTVIDDGSSSPWWGNGGNGFDFPWWNDGWNWNPGWDGGPWGGGGWNGGGWW
jgi:hypothetical protein